MRPAIQSSHPLHTIFGSGYVPEHRGDETQRHLPAAGHDSFAVDFGEILKALRGALSLR